MDTEGRSHRKTEAETGVTRPQAKERQSPQKPEEVMEDSAPGSSVGAGLWPLQEKLLLLF